MSRTCTSRSASIASSSPWGIFAINELPDLAGKIQVGLFNILQEGDVQIKGYPIRLKLDVMLVFTANPEDYTARGKIITPLKDRLGSQIRTHYPQRIADEIAVIRQEAHLVADVPVGLFLSAGVDSGSSAPHAASAVAAARRASTRPLPLPSRRHHSAARSGSAGTGPRLVPNGPTVVLTSATLAVGAKHVQAQP